MSNAQNFYIPKITGNYFNWFLKILINFQLTLKILSYMSDVQYIDLATFKGNKILYFYKTPVFKTLWIFRRTNKF